MREGAGDAVRLHRRLRNDFEHLHAPGAEALLGAGAQAVRREPILRWMERPVAGALALSVGAWAALAWLALDMGHPLAQLTMPASPHWSAANVAAVLVMWAVMMAAMMLPSALPMVHTFARLGRDGAGEASARARAFVAAYLVVTDDGITVIDAGLPGHWRDLRRELATIGRSIGDIQERIATQHVLAVKTRCAEAGVSAHAHTVEAVHPYEAIVDHAKLQGCDLIVMASHGRKGLKRLLLGSETQHVLTHSHIPVLVLR